MTHRMQLLDRLFAAVAAQVAEPGGADRLRIDVLAAYQKIAAHDGAPLVYPEQYGDEHDPDGRNWAYIGRKDCGCFRAAQSADPRYPAQIAHGLAEMVQAGLIIERVPVAYVRARFGAQCARCRRPSADQESLPL